MLPQRLRLRQQRQLCCFGWLERVISASGVWGKRCDALGRGYRPIALPDAEMQPGT